MYEKGINMSMQKKNHLSGFFQNLPEFFTRFKGQIIEAKDIKLADLSRKKVAIIGANQPSVSYLDHITQHAESVKVFLIKPHFVLPHTEKAIHQIVTQPVLLKNRRLFKPHVKILLATRYLESQINDNWLRRHLAPNPANPQKIFFKSDAYYAALQRSNCKLITWPVIRITENGVYSLEGTEHHVDLVVTTFD